MFGSAYFGWPYLGQGYPRDIAVEAGDAQPCAFVIVGELVGAVRIPAVVACVEVPMMEGTVCFPGRVAVTIPELLEDITA